MNVLGNDIASLMKGKKQNITTNMLWISTRFNPFLLCTSLQQESRGSQPAHFSSAGSCMRGLVSGTYNAKCKSKTTLEVLRP